ncbi:MAG TPA: VCBS repeat-containing protein [Bacteroidia bacterium]|nr:VCBS repeat-containing protein [Bacteroidia bacterium]
MKRLSKLNIASILLLIAFVSCKKVSTSDETQQFRLLSPQQSGIEFSNALVDNDEVVLHYQYRYNGNGVAVGDINNDGLPDLFFAGVNAQEQLYLNKGSLKFENISQAAGILPHTGISTGAVMVDINADGWLDIYVCKFGKFEPKLRKNQLYINQKNNTFIESAVEYGLDDESFSSQATFFDYDKDGDVDLFLVNSPVTHEMGSIILFKPDTERTYVSNRLYRNDGDKKFTDVTFSAGVDNKGFGFNASVYDFNYDGWPDIYVTNDFISPDFLYINQKDGTFKEQLKDHFRITSNSSMGSDIGDINNDGLMDLITLDMLPESNHRLKMLRGPMNYDEYTMAAQYGYFYQHMRNMLHLNNGNGTFSEIGQLAGVSNTDWSWGPLLADFNNDGWTDLFVANGYRRDLTNLDYTHYFLDSINKSGGLSQFKHLYELFNKVPSTPLQNYMYFNKGNLTFENKSTELGFVQKTYSNGSMYSDLDKDGDLDIIINNIDEVAYVYENVLGAGTVKNYIQFQLNGIGGNTQGIGACIQIWTNNSMQVKCYVPSTGFYSCAENNIHFGLGGSNSVDSMHIVWADGQCQMLYSIDGNKRIKLNQSESKPCSHKIKTEIAPIFTDKTDQSDIRFNHTENVFIDYKREPLLPFKFSSVGPCIATADINQDGRTDVFISNATGSSSKTFVQLEDETFIELKQAALLEDKDFEDVAAEWMDYDRDGDMDLFVVSGGNEWNEDDKHYAPRVYNNNGSGILSKAEGILPDIKISASCIRAYDFDSDGDEDVFIGGAVIPGKYPLSPKSYLLINENGKFIDATKRVSNELLYAGLINDALWADVNGDSKKDLVISGYWEPIKIYLNNGTKLELQSGNGLEKTNGWWNCVKAIDIDADGDVDLIGGNLGLNSRVKASELEPACVYAKDFDDNGSVDAIMCYYVQGKSYPVHNRDVLVDQIRPLKKSLLRYYMYADAQIEDLFTIEQLNDALVLNAYMLESAWFENDGKGNFIKQALPLETQFAPVQDILSDDFNKDGILDLLLVGNFHDAEVETGRYTAFNGLLLSGKKDKSFVANTVIQSGFFNSSDARSLAHIPLKEKSLILVGNNNDRLRVFEYSSKHQKPYSAKR